MPCVRASRGLVMVTGFAVDEDLTGVGRVGSCERVDERRLAGAVAADEGDDFTGIEVDADAVDGVDATERHTDVAHVDERHPSVAGSGRGGGAGVGHCSLLAH